MPIQVSGSPAGGAHLGLIPWTPDPVAIQLGPIPIAWYGIGYALGLAAAYLVMTREARRRGLDVRVVDNGIIVVTVAGLVGGRIYHVIDQWDYYSDHLTAIVTPPYRGLGVLGGIITATLALAVLLRRWQQSFWAWADVVAPGAFLMQAFARWGNFFNQELYGPPTGLPWGVAIDCEHRVAQWPCSTHPEATTGFTPLFLYESISGVLGAITLLVIARRWGGRLRSGELFLVWLIWYAVVRIALESLRVNVWTTGGVPTATLVAGALGLGALGVLVGRRLAARDGRR